MRNRRLSNPSTSSGRSYESDSFARSAEKLARFLGTGRYLAAQTVALILWIGINVAAGVHGLWDKYPFKTLNLAFSMQAAYAAPMILLAQNRQTDRDKQEAERDRMTNALAFAQTDFLAREIADLKVCLASKLDRRDLLDPDAEVAQTLTRLGDLLGVSLDPVEDE